MRPQIVSTCKRIDELIDRLPEVAGGEEAQLQRIAALQVRGVQGLGFRRRSCSALHSCRCELFRL